MAPSHVQGLNLVYPDTQQSLFNDQDLLTVPNELAAQLDLWTNLSFQSDEPLPLAGSSASGSSARRAGDADPKKRTHDADADEDGVDAAVQRGVLSADALNAFLAQQQQAHYQAQAAPARQQPNFELSNFLSSIGMPLAIAPVSGPDTTAPSLATILALYAQQTQQQQASSAAPAPPAASEQPASGRATKRARTRKASISASAAAAEELAEPASPTDAGDDDVDEDGNTLSTPMTATEDKRRRNTAASARFRAKKKEREAALERRAKDLEGRVADLERECEALRRENGWLKGLVVGVTGANTSVGAGQPGVLPPQLAALKRD